MGSWVAGSFVGVLSDCLSWADRSSSDMRSVGGAAARSDVAEAVNSPMRLSEASAPARRLLSLVPDFPTVTWGRDELHTGDMWNSNSLVSWLLERSGHDTDLVHPPPRGRAPGWAAGLVVARLQFEQPPHCHLVREDPGHEALGRVVQLLAR